MASAQMETWLTTFFRTQAGASGDEETRAQLVRLIMETVGGSGTDSDAGALGKALKENVGEFLDGGPFPRDSASYDQGSRV